MDQRSAASAALHPQGYHEGRGILKRARAHGHVDASAARDSGGHRGRVLILCCWSKRHDLVGAWWAQSTAEAYRDSEVTHGHIRDCSIYLPGGRELGAVARWLVIQGGGRGRRRRPGQRLRLQPWGPPRDDLRPQRQVSPVMG